MKRWSGVFIQCLLAGTLLILLFWRLRVGMTRFFDVDEFSYLHWAAELVKGQRPYVDFFMFFTPGFLWFFAPLVKVFWMSTHLFIAARVVAFGIFLGVLGGLGILFGKTRGWKWALLPVIILSFLPMPYDKFLEVRPDNLAVLIGLVGLISQISGRSFLSGFFYSLSLLVFVKTLPFFVVGAIVAFFTKENKKSFFVGIAVPLALFFLWLVTLGDFSMAWYSLTTLPFEVNMIGKFDIMEPHLFFFPNASFYGGQGITLGLILNHTIWIIGIVMGVYRFFTPLLTNNAVLIEVLVSGTFLLSVAGYIQFFPLKHSQYLIPIAVFIAYYAADAIQSLGRIRGIWVIGGIWVLIVATTQVNKPKLHWSNALQLAQTKTLLSTIPSDANILDLEGRMLFWHDAYHICCIPFGSFTRFMSRKPPVLRDELESKRTPFIFQGNTGRIATLQALDQQYIHAMYKPVEGWGDVLWKRNHFVEKP